MNVTFARINLVRISGLLVILAGIAAAADQAGLYAVGERKAAPDFVLQDAADKTAKLQDYRGKVILLDFWATWCTGCKKEIPWFSEFQQTYGSKGFAVVGVSMDEGGWKVLKPFLAEHPVPYRMLLGDEATAKRYGAESLPDTFLIDRKGRVAAAYKAVLVDKDKAEAQVKALVSEP